MGLESRPFVGTWRLGRNQVVQTAPDSLVYINGQMSVPGCPVCNGRINIQEFVTEVSVDLGTEPGSASASFTLSVPVHHNETLARDARFIFRPGLEVQIYMRGYFPVAGMFTHGGTENKEFKDILAYPYYPTFHGVVIQVGHSYSAGVQTISIQCASILHFWQYQQVSTNAAIFGPKPTNSGLKSSELGHNYSGQHPYEIMWHIHNDFVSASAGVGFVLSQRTNQTASFNGEALQSVTAKYWEERFKSRFIKLRMHGATGTLFNAAQAAYVGRASSEKLLSDFKNRFAAPKPGTNKSPLSTARTLEGGKPEISSALDSLGVTKPGGDENGESQGFELNLVEMKAFVNDISQYGGFNLFESTYESKLDIANKVCEITGFEFYQDVDGDFVFKPPMYNLDTSGSRVYRIEDIDIINISFDEKEPQATYITTKGSHFKNLAGHGVDNEWGVQGQYIDWRLVAQFGWRPNDFETAYYNNKSAIFFAAMNRLDTLNAPCRSAAVTIPIRPEIRPGYPVYIPYLDAFYYCNNFSHSYSVGGQCTTNLQLIAKRAKFFAPKDPMKTGIGAIDLSNMLLPPGPLQVQDSNGRPALAGFPNVVMSIDPAGIDPREVMLGGNMYIPSEDALAGIVKMALDKNIISHPEGRTGGPYYIFHSGSDGQADIAIEFSNKFDPDDTSSVLQENFGGGGRPLSLNAAVEELKVKHKSIEDTKIIAQKDIDKLIKEQKALEKQLASAKTDAQKTALTAKIQKNQDAINRKASAVAMSQNMMEEDWTKTGEVTAIKTLWALIQSVVGNSFGGDIEASSTTFLLSMLADKKASISTGSLPGSFRYYSASHPDPSQQGLRLASVNATASNSGISLGSCELDSPATVTGFSQASILQHQSGWTPEATFVDGMTVTNGIKVRTGDPAFKDGKVIATSEIRELMFTPVNYRMDSVAMETLNVADIGIASDSIRMSIIASARSQAATNGKAGVTLGDVFSSWVSTVNRNFQAAFAAASEIGSGLPVYGFIDAVESCVISNVSISLSDIPKDRLIAGKAFGVADWSDISLWNQVAEQYAATLWNQQIAPKNVAWPKALKAAGGLNEETQKKILTTFYTSLAGSFGVRNSVVYKEQLSKKTKAKEKGQKGSKHPTKFAPVFPVSDSRGYEVVGSQRYGRDVDSDSGGVWSDLISRNVLEALDSRTVDDVVNLAYGQRKGLTGERMKQLVQNIMAQDPESDRTIKLGAMAARNQLDVGLRNWYKDTKDAVTKIQLVNAAYTLANLTPTGRNTPPCSCRTAEANIMLEDAQSSSFVSVVAGMVVSPTSDAVTQYATKATAAAGIDWKMRQDALRGTTVDRQRSSTVEFFRNLDETFDQASQATAALTQDFVADAKATYKEAAQNVKNEWSRDKNQR